MWFGWSSRLLLPERKTLDSLSNVSAPSGAGYSRLPDSTGSSASRWNFHEPPGRAPRVMSMIPPIGAPTNIPLPSAWRMLRTFRRSLQMWLRRTRSS